MPYQHEVEDMIRLEIINKINAGHFKLIPNPNDKSLVWRIFALIATTKCSIISGYVCCTKCSKLLKRDGIHHHGCHQLQKNLKDRANNAINILDGGNIMLPGGKIQIERKKEKRKVDISEKLNNGEYKLTMDRNSQNEIKNIFATIIKQDGSCVKGYLYCTKCRSILKCESWNSRSFKSHPCSKHLYTQNSSTSTLDSSEHCCIKRQHSGEKFDEVDTDSDDDQGKSGIKKQRMGMEGSFISNQVNDDTIKSDYDHCDDEFANDTPHNNSGGSYSICVKEEYNYPNAATPETNVNDDMMCQMDDNSKHLVSIKQEICVKEEYNYTEQSSSTNDNSSQLVSIKRELDDNA